MTSIRKLFIALVISTLFLAGCGGGGTSVTTSSTMGQELQDLEKSYKDGLLSDSEYKTARKSILRRYN